MLQWLVYIPTILGLIVIGIFVLLSNPKNRVNKTFTLFVSLLVAWLVCLFIADTTHSSATAFFFVRTAIVFSSAYVPIFLYFAYIFPNPRPLSKAKAAYLCIIPAVMISLAYSNLMISEVVIKPWGAEVTGSGVMYSIQGVYVFMYMMGAFVLLLRKARRTRGKERSQLYLVSGSVGFVLLVNIITQTILPVLGVGQYAILFGVPAFFVFIVGVAYSILKHKLFDIRAVVARSVTYVFTIALIGGVYGFIAFRLTGSLLENVSGLYQEVVYTILAIVLAFLFQPIRRFFEKVSNKIFYKDRYDSQKLVNDIGRIVASEIDLDKMTKAVLGELTEKMKIVHAEIVIFGEKQLFYENDVFKKDGQAISETDLRKLGRVMQIADDISSGERKKIMQSYGISVSIALRTTEKFLGYLLLAEKKSGDIYNNEDIATLKIVANELSVAAQNSLSYKEIQQFSETLAEKVRQRTAQLRRANDQLKELDKAKDEFISMASHQLRTPLTTIKGYVSMLDEGDFGKLTKEQKKYVEQALDGSNRMARLISDLLDVSRMEAGKFFIDAQKLDLNKIVPQELEQLKNLADSKGVDLRYVKPKKAVPIMNLDENKTRQVIMNLADNAVHYSAPPKGGGKVEVRLEQDGENIVYVVRDNGIGVPRDQQGKLFTKMFRAKNAQEVRPDGTGLGLYLVKRVVEDQGGKLIFESTPGKGSVFGFKIPVHNKIVVDKKAQKALLEAHKNG